MTSPPSRQIVLSLYRNMMRESSKFSSYIYRTYALRRIRDAFKENKTVNDNVKIQQLVEEGKQNLDIIRRQVVVNSLYQSDKLVIENQKNVS